MLTFKFVTKDYLSPGGYGKLDYSGPWPKTLETEVDPASLGQCAKGIHVIPLHEEADLTNIVTSHRIIILDVAEEDIVFREGFGKMRASRVIVLGEASDEQKNLIRELWCKDPYYAYIYALDVDKAPRDDTRESCLKDPYYAYRYARDVDKAPRDDTREACLEDPKCAYIYALDVDKAPRDDTREASMKDPYCARLYEEAFSRASA